MQYIKFNGKILKQPSSYEPQWETTYTADTQRVLSGELKATPLFTVESFSLEWTGLTAAEASAILQEIVSTPSKPNFEFYYFSWYYGVWKTGIFYVGKGSLKCRTMKEGDESWRSISCNVICVNPIK